ncbi:MAG TPA: hypothetical protein VJN02_03210 [Gammaproteobacteria bacterium]|nr:hypothetical protein [Gammaproteobacteria bacterium]
MLKKFKIFENIQPVYWLDNEIKAPITHEQQGTIKINIEENLCFLIDALDFDFDECYRRIAG